MFCSLSTENIIAPAFPLPASKTIQAQSHGGCFCRLLGERGWCYLCTSPHFRSLCIGYYRPMCALFCVGSYTALITVVSECIKQHDNTSLTHSFSRPCLRKRRVCSGVFCLDFLYTCTDTHTATVCVCVYWSRRVKNMCLALRQSYVYTTRATTGQLCHCSTEASYVDGFSCQHG